MTHLRKSFDWISKEWAREMEAPTKKYTKPKTTHELKVENELLEKRLKALTAEMDKMSAAMAKTTLKSTFRPKPVGSLREAILINDFKSVCNSLGHVAVIENDVVLITASKLGGRCRHRYRRYSLVSNSDLGGILKKFLEEECAG